MRDSTRAERVSIQRYSNICLGIKRRCTPIAEQHMNLMNTGRWAEAKRLMRRLTTVEIGKSFQPQQRGQTIIDGIEKGGGCTVLSDLE